MAADPNPDPNPTMTFTLVPGDGSDDNASFTINGANLVAAANLDFIQKPSWKIRVHADNGHPNGTFEKAIVINPFGNENIQTAPAVAQSGRNRRVFKSC
jgi:hypothetical protein